MNKFFNYLKKNLKMEMTENIHVWQWQSMNKKKFDKYFFLFQTEADGELDLDVISSRIRRIHQVNNFISLQSYNLLSPSICKIQIRRLIAEREICDFMGKMIPSHSSTLLEQVNKDFDQLLYKISKWIFFLTIHPTKCHLNYKSHYLFTFPFYFNFVVW